MTFVIGDRIKEQSITQGSGTITLSGAYGAFVPFSQGVGDNNTTYYCIENEKQYEIGIGLYSSSSNTLTRSPISSSNSNSLIDINGASVVFGTIPADYITDISGVLNDLNDAVGSLSGSTIASGAPIVSKLGFTTSGDSSQYRVNDFFFDVVGGDVPVREATINAQGLLQIEVASFSPSVSANGQSLSWDQPATQWTVSVTNPDDFTSRYINNVNSTLTSATAGVTTDVSLYSTSGPSATPLGGVDWTQTFSTDADSNIYSLTANLTGGSASAVVSFDDNNGSTYSETSTISYNWQDASCDLSFSNLSGNTFLETYSSVGYTLTVNGLSNPSNASSVITTGQGSLSSSNSSGTMTFTTPIHKDNNSGRTISVTTTFTRPAGVTGTSYSDDDTSSDSTISANFTYPSFYIFTNGIGTPPTRSDIINGNGFESSVTQLGDQVKDIDQFIATSSPPKALWFAVRTSASQPTSFQTGSSDALLSDVSVTTGYTVNLEPDSPPAGYSSESYTLYGITLASTNTYVRIS